MSEDIIGFSISTRMLADESGVGHIHKHALNYIRCFKVRSSQFYGNHKMSTFLLAQTSLRLPGNTDAATVTFNVVKR